MLPVKGYCSETADSDMEESDVESIKSQQLSPISTTEEVQHQSFNNSLTDEVEFECNSDTELISQEDQLVKCNCILGYLYSYTTNRNWIQPANGTDINSLVIILTRMSSLAINVMKIKGCHCITFMAMQLEIDWICQSSLMSVLD